jgi:hypothetical protein
MYQHAIATVEMKEKVLAATPDVVDALSSQTCCELPRNGATKASLTYLHGSYPAAH